MSACDLLAHEYLDQLRELVFRPRARGRKRAGDLLAEHPAEQRAQHPHGALGRTRDLAHRRERAAPEPVAGIEPIDEGSRERHPHGARVITDKEGTAQRRRVELHDAILEHLTAPAPEVCATRSAG